MHCGTILVIEDDPDILRLIRDCLQASQFEVVWEQSGVDGIETLKRVTPDVLILDLNLPDMDGLTVCREIRKSSGLPILILSSQGEDMDKVIGLEVGADDYMAKPFNPRELVARVRALIRRSGGFETEQSESNKVLTVGKISIDTLAHTASVGENALHLTPIEFDLLKSFAARPTQVLTRQVLLDLVWGDDYVGDERIVDVHIRNLRMKLKDHDQAEHIVSVRGVGYKWVD